MSFLDWKMFDFKLMILLWLYFNSYDDDLKAEGLAVQLYLNKMLSGDHYPWCTTCSGSELIFRCLSLLSPPFFFWKIKKDITSGMIYIKTWSYHQRAIIAWLQEIGIGMLCQNKTCRRNDVVRNERQTFGDCSTCKLSMKWINNPFRPALRHTVRLTSKQDYCWQQLHYMLLISSYVSVS